MALAPRGEVERKEQGDNRDPAQENGPERAAVEQNRERDKADEEDDGAAAVGAEAISGNGDEAE